MRMRGTLGKLRRGEGGREAALYTRARYAHAGMAREHAGERAGARAGTGVHVTRDDGGLWQTPSSPYPLHSFSTSPLA